MRTENKIKDDMTPLFLELGKALFICQSLEESLHVFNAQLSHDETDGEEGLFGLSLDLYSNDTMGQLINKLRKRIDIPEDLSDYLESGLWIRNEIVHGYMTKNFSRLAHPQGRIEVLAELAAMKLEVKKRSILVNKLLDALFAKDGFASAELKRNVDELRAFINAA